MRRVIHKWFWAWDFDKEEQWLNEMAARGLALVAIGVCKYTFEESLPGEYNVRLELLDNLPSHAESERYIKFIEDTGAEYLGSITRWAYFRSRTDAGEFSLFSDNASRIRHLNRLLPLLSVVTLSQIPIAISNLSFYLGIGNRANLGVGILCLCLASLGLYGTQRIFFKRRKLRKEQRLFE